MRCQIVFDLTHCVRQPNIVGSFELESTRYGARAGSRTLNLGIKSPLLCQLSYASACERGRLTILSAART
jgi:hypothetical protein